MPARTGGSNCSGFYGRTWSNMDLYGGSVKLAQWARWLLTNLDGGTLRGAAVGSFDHGTRVVHRGDCVA
ncbi:hypothetical protein GCM10028775_04970 [Catellatospora paridis]